MLLLLFLRSRSFTPPDADDGHAFPPSPPPHVVSRAAQAPLGATMNADGTVSDTPAAVAPVNPAAEAEASTAAAAAAAAAAANPAAPAVPGTTVAPGALDAAMPDLADLVTDRKRAFSVGLDPEVEQTAAEWFESLGYRTLSGDTHYTKGFWGGTVTEKDARMAVSFCTSTSDVSLLSGFDFANWLPVPNVYDSLVLDFPDAKFILFETPVDLWMTRIQEKALAAQVMGRARAHFRVTLRAPLPSLPSGGGLTRRHSSTVRSPRREWMFRVSAGGGAHPVLSGVKRMSPEKRM